MPSLSIKIIMDACSRILSTNFIALNNYLDVDTPQWISNGEDGFPPALHLLVGSSATWYHRCSSKSKHSTLRMALGAWPPTTTITWVGDTHTHTQWRCSSICCCWEGLGARRSPWGNRPGSSSVCGQFSSGPSGQPAAGGTSWPRSGSLYTHCCSWSATPPPPASNTDRKWEDSWARHVAAAVWRKTPFDCNITWMSDIFISFTFCLSLLFSRINHRLIFFLK